MPSSFVLQAPPDEMNLDYTLPSGQAFRWRKSAEGWWTGVVYGATVSVRQTGSALECRTIPDTPDASLLIDYFRLGDNIQAIYNHLANSDPHLVELLSRFRGLRLLRQDPTEALLSFICSAANSIPRISRAIEGLSRAYGRYIGSLDDQDYYSFPETSSLADAEVSQLRRVGGLGFRGESLKSVARQIMNRPDNWLMSLRHAPYEQAVSELMSIRGVGRKIADCVCLFALDKDEAVPVDTHVRQLTMRLYLPAITQKSVTPAVYEQIGGHFRQRFGQYAGWAQQFLFYEDVLRSRGKHAIAD